MFTFFVVPFKQNSETKSLFTDTRVFAFRASHQKPFLQNDLKPLFKNGQ